MAVPQKLKAFNRKVPAPAPAALPVLTYADGATLHLNGETVNIMHVPNAHTDGDRIVQFEKADVIHMGDTFFNGFFPFIDVEQGGTAMGMIGAADKALAMSSDNTQIIPGHGPIADKAALKAFRDMLSAMHDLVEAAKASGQGHRCEMGPWFFERPCVLEAGIRRREMSASVRSARPQRQAVQSCAGQQRGRLALRPV